MTLCNLERTQWQVGRTLNWCHKQTSPSSRLILVSRNFTFCCDVPFFFRPHEITLKFFYLELLHEVFGLINDVKNCLLLMGIFPLFVQEDDSLLLLWPIQLCQLQLLVIWGQLHILAHCQKRFLDLSFYSQCVPFSAGLFHLLFEQCHCSSALLLLYVASFFEFTLVSADPLHLFLCHRFTFVKNGTLFSTLNSIGFIFKFQVMFSCFKAEHMASFIPWGSGVGAPDAAPW